MAFGIDDGIMIAMALASLFGGGNSQRQTTTTEQQPRGYQSPMLGLLDPYITKALLGNYSRLQGAGFPDGLQNLGLGDMTNDIYSLLAKSWPEITKGYSQKDSTDCEAKCRQTYSEHTDAPDAWKKFQECKSKCGQSSGGA